MPQHELCRTRESGGGSWDLVTSVLNKVTMLICNYNPNQGRMPLHSSTRVGKELVVVLGGAAGDLQPCNKIVLDREPRTFLAYCRSLNDCQYYSLRVPYSIYTVKERKPLLELLKPLH